MSEAEDNKQLKEAQKEAQKKVQLYLLAMHLFEELEHLREFDFKPNRKRVNRCAKDVILWVKTLKVTGVKFEAWKDYKRLSRDLPDYKFTPNIDELENLKDLIRKPKKEKLTTTFESLFRDPKYPEKVKQIFKNNYFTKNGKWVYNGNANTLATAFFVLSDPEPIGEIHAIIPGKLEPQLTVFYKEFGLTIAQKKEEGVYTTIRNAKTRPQYFVNETPTYKIFQDLFQSLKLPD
ncbi:hypothetical protein ES705_38379 [subsurface metagenome]